MLPHLHRLPECPKPLPRQPIPRTTKNHRPLRLRIHHPQPFPGDLPRFLLQLLPNPGKITHRVKMPLTRRQRHHPRPMQHHANLPQLTIHPPIKGPVAPRPPRNPRPVVIPPVRAKPPPPTKRLALHQSRLQISQIRHPQFFPPSHPLADLPEPEKPALTPTSSTPKSRLTPNCRTPIFQLAKLGIFQGSDTNERIMASARKQSSTYRAWNTALRRRLT